MDKTPILEKLRKVLALTNSSEEEEAAAAAAMAAKIMDEYNLSALDIENLQPENNIADRQISEGWQYKAWEMQLYVRLATVYDCAIYTSRKFDSKLGSDGRYARVLRSTVVKVIGFKSDTEVLEYIYNYLHRVIEEHLTALKNRLKEMGLTKNQKKCGEYIHNYAYGMIDRIYETIRASRNVFQDTNDRSRALVVAKAAEVDTFLQQKHMKDNKIKGCGQIGYDHGYKDGSAISVNDAINGGSTDTLAIGRQYA